MFPTAFCLDIANLLLLKKILVISFSLCVPPCRLEPFPSEPPTRPGPPRPPQPPLLNIPPADLCNAPLNHDSSHPYPSHTRVARSESAPPNAWPPASQLCSACLYRLPNTSTSASSPHLSNIRIAAWPEYLYSRHTLRQSLDQVQCHPPSFAY
eukprot:jgi/Botrbrau1/11255/Bobra.0038s0027.1